MKLRTSVAPSATTTIHAFVFTGCVILKIRFKLIETQMHPHGYDLKQIKFKEAKQRREAKCKAVLENNIVKVGKHLIINFAWELLHLLKPYKKPSL